MGSFVDLTYRIHIIAHLSRLSIVFDRLWSALGFPYDRGMEENSAWLALQG